MKSKALVKTKKTYELGHPQCPFCKQLQERIKKIEDRNAHLEYIFSEIEHAIDVMEIKEIITKKLQRLGENR